MDILTAEKFDSALKQIGIVPGDTLFIHSDLRMFKVAEEDICKFYYSCLNRILGIKGTLAVPAYFYEYARFGETFDVDHSPVSINLGSFSRYIASRPERVRSCNPLQSIAAVGGKAQELCGSLSLSGYGVTSPWHKLREMKGKILFLGVTLQPMTYVHYIEQQYGVPHLYFKAYSHPIFKDGKQLNGKPVSAVRYLDYHIEYDLSRFEQHLMTKGIIKKSDLPIFAVDAEAVFQEGIKCLDKDVYFFLKHPPKFVPGKIPTDGHTGPLQK